MLSMVVPEELAATRTSFVRRAPFPPVPVLSFLLLLLPDFVQLMKGIVRSTRRAKVVRG